MKEFLLLLMLVFVGGCAQSSKSPFWSPHVPSEPTLKNWLVTDGSKGDGTVDLQFQYTLYEKPIKINSGYSSAIGVCQKWKYSEAEESFAAIKKCNRQKLVKNTYICVSWLVTKKFQCIE